MPRQEQGIEYYLTPAGEKRFRVRWREGRKHRSRSFRRLAGESGARQFYRKVREAQDARARLPAPSAAGLTLAEFVADTWAPRAKRRLAPNTWKRDAAVYNKHVLRQLGERPIVQIDSEDLVEWQDEMERSGTGGPTTIKAMSILSSIFREAARRTRSTGVRVNPVAALDRPSARRCHRPRVWGPVVVERVRYELVANSRRSGGSSSLVAVRDALLISVMEMTGCRPGEALALRWRDVDDRVAIAAALSGKEMRSQTKTDRDRIAPLLVPLAVDLAKVRAMGGDRADDFVIQTPRGGHWVETDWRNFRSRHFVPALKRVELHWPSWRESLDDPAEVRESVADLSGTRPYDLGRHTHSALMLASGMSLQRLARIQGHSIRVLDDTYSEQLAEFEDRDERIDPVEEINRARALVWRDRDPSSGEPL